VILRPIDWSLPSRRPAELDHHRRVVKRGARRIAVLKWALIFLVISIVAGALGFTNLSSAAAGIAKILFFVFLAVFLLFVILALLAGEAIF
jgi:uncharacterized membrane protein YtjA (UPF0391 family)